MFYSKTIPWKPGGYVCRTQRRGGVQRVVKMGFFPTDKARVTHVLRDRLTGVDILGGPRPLFSRGQKYVDKK